MDDHTPPTTGDDAAASDGSPRHGFETPEGLRALLIRLHEAGPGAWWRDREAAELMRYTAERYRRLASKYGLDEWEVASAAFEVMLAASTRNAGNPWAVVSRAVQITCGVEVRAAGMFVSPSKVCHTARIVGFHDAIRFAERENLADYHPAFAVNSSTDDEEDSGGRVRVAAVLSEIVGLFASAGWDVLLVTDCIEHVAYRLGDLTSRSNAVEVLRRDHTVPVLLGIPPRSWAALVRIVLGHPDLKHAGTATGEGVLLRLLSGEPLDSLALRHRPVGCDLGRQPGQADRTLNHRGRGVAPISMSTPTAPATAAPDSSAPLSQPADSTLGARLAAASRQAQGLPSTVDDPAVLAELRGLCTAPRLTKRAVAKVREGPAP